MTKATERAPRADAVRNRDKLVTAARTVFAESGVDAPLDRIATDAGVGIGTLYRNFPSREALIEAVYRSQSEEIVTNGRRFGETLPPDDALVAVFGEYLRTAASKRGMKEVILAELGAEAPVFVDSRAASQEMIGAILSAGQNQGMFRLDVTAADVFRLIGGLSMTCHMNMNPADSAPLVRVVIDGLRRVD